jgi:hypothetical protein
MRDHTKLRAFQLANELALATYKATRAFPKEEIFGITAQMRRAAVFRRLEHWGRVREELRSRLPAFPGHRLRFRA